MAYWIGALILAALASLAVYTWNSLSERTQTALLVPAAILGAAIFFRVLWMGLDRLNQAEAEGYRRLVEAREKDPDAVACRARGGIVIRSGWDGRIIDCKVVNR